VRYLAKKIQQGLCHGKKCRKPGTFGETPFTFGQKWQAQTCLWRLFLPAGRSPHRRQKYPAKGLDVWQGRGHPFLDFIFFMQPADQTDFAQSLLVGMADVLVVHNQNAILRTPPLGACLGISIYDPRARVSGVLHSMLPDSGIDPARAASRPGMFLDSGLAAMLTEAGKLGAKLENLSVCVAGGARILDETSYFNIGHRNFEVLTRLLKELGLELQGRDVGGLSNRSMQLNAVTGEVRLKVSGQPKMKVLCKPSTTT
jgi:chemotaxis protein CheD